MAVTHGPAISYSISATAAGGKGMAISKPVRPFRSATAQRQAGPPGAAILRPARPTTVMLRPAGLTGGPRFPPLTHQILRPAGLSR